jgi:hypothetical protein
MYANLQSFQSSKDSSLYLGSSLFESRPGHRLYWRPSCSSSFPGKFQDSGPALVAIFDGMWLYGIHI